MAVCVHLELMCEYFILSCSLVGPPFTPIITVVTPQTTFINLVWSQQDGDVVVSYTVSYSFITRGCDGTIRGRNTITGIDGFIRAYNLSNIEENSDIDISIKAVNGAGSSPVPASTSSTTLEAGEIFMSNLLCFHLTHIHTHTLPAAPSGIVSSLKTTTITPTAISISWGRVACVDRNIEITKHVVIYGPTSNSNDRISIFIVDINTNNVYTITGLRPRTGYTIQVRADNPTVSGIFMGTMLATVNAETAVPEGKV